MKIDIPAFLSHLRVSDRGYPIPWFTPIEKGIPNFNYQDHKKLEISIERGLCHICGKKLHKDFIYFISGENGLKNQTSSDMAMHRDCAEYSLNVCPYMIYQKLDRKTPDDHPPEFQHEKPDHFYLIKATKYKAVYYPHLKQKMIHYKAVSAEKYFYINNKLTKAK